MTSKEIKIILLLTVLLITEIASSKDKPDWFYPQGIKFGTYTGDTCFYGGVVSVWRIRKGDTLFEYYPDGHLQSISLIKLSNSFTLIDTNRSECTIYEYERNGFCKVFFDDSLNSIVVSGQYKNNERVGEWSYYDRDGKLLRISEVISFAKDDYTIREIDYSSGHPILTVDRKFLAYYLRNFFIIMAIIFGSFFGRMFINSRIYNIENGTNYSPIYFYFPGFVSRSWWHSMLCTFTFWFVNYKPENRRLVVISNTLSLIALGTFFAILIGLAINGELH